MQYSRLTLAGLLIVSLSYAWVYSSGASASQDTSHAGRGEREWGCGRPNRKPQLKHWPIGRSRKRASRGLI